MDRHKLTTQLLMAGAMGAVLTLGGLVPTQVTALAADDSVGQTTTTHADTDKVAFADPTLKAIVAKALNITGDVTYGDIRHYQGIQPSLHGYEFARLSSLEGLQSLRELPKGIGIDITVDLDRGVSLAPFKGLPISGGLTIQQDGTHSVDFTVLNSVHVMEDPTHFVLRQVALGGTSMYVNYDGLTDADVKKLQPLFTQFANLKQKNYDGRIRITLTGQRLTDFSFFKQFGKVQLTAAGQYDVFDKKIYIDPATFNAKTTVRLPAQIKGMDGELLQTSTRAYYADPAVKLSGTDALVTNIKANTKWLIIDHQINTVGYPHLDGTTYANGSTLVMDGMQYYPVVWEKAPDSSSESSGNGGTSTPVPTPKPTEPASQSSSEASSSAQVMSGGSADTIAPKGTVVYATKAIYLYQRPTFKKSQRRVKYVKQPRINRPMFVVTGYAQSQAGRARYVVKDVNHHSKTAGKTGYITANRHFTLPVYYQTKHAQITVINPQGVNAYRKLGLKSKATHYRQGQTLKVVGIKHYRLTTRFKLKNGTYVTANRKLVKAGKVTMPKFVRTKTKVNRYRTADLTRKHGAYRKGTRVKVTGWTYSRANDVAAHGVLRYRVAGGYVTGNSRYVTVVR